MEVAVVGDALVVTVDKHQMGKTVSELCTQELRLPAHFVQQLVRQGTIRINKTVALLDTTVRSGQRVSFQGGVQESYGVDLAVADEMGGPGLGVLYEDAHVMVVNKPSGLIMYPGSPEDMHTLAHLVADYYRRSGLLRKVRHVHRLDRDTTGTVLYAKHGYSARALDALMASHDVQRTYLALVHGTFPQKQGTIEGPIGRDRHTAGRWRVSTTGKAAVTDYKVMAVRPVINGHVSLLSCRLRTGRTHQIRVHLSSLGHPVVGDELYGAGHGVGRIPYREGHALHAWRLSFVHPYTNAAVTVEAGLPEPFQHLLDELGMNLSDER